MCVGIHIAETAARQKPPVPVQSQQEAHDAGHEDVGECQKDVEFDGAVDPGPEEPGENAQSDHGDGCDDADRSGAHAIVAGDPEMPRHARGSDHH